MGRDEGDDGRIVTPLDIIGHQACERLATSRRLADQQRRVFRGMLRLLTDAEIGEELRLKPNTVHEHAGKVLRKFGVHRRSELDALCIFETRGPPDDGADRDEP